MVGHRARRARRKVVERLMAPDMWSGWGIRTLSAQNPAFNPYNYQTGSVWPHDNGIIALGFKRYGFGAEAARIARDISEAGTHFLLNRLPELYTAPQRDGTPFPCNILAPTCRRPGPRARYSACCRPCWAFMPDAPNGKLYIDPLLPRWLPDLTVFDLRVGKHRLDISFWREGEETKLKYCAATRRSSSAVAASNNASG